MKHLFVFIICIALIFCSANAQTGELDKSFGDQGIVIGNGYTGSSRDILIQKDNKIIAGGEGGYNDLGGFLLVRYNNDGTIDNSFGDAGKVVTTFDNVVNNGVYFRKAALQDDGKILATGYIYLGSNVGNNLALARYNTDGSLDSNFGAGGKVTTQIKSNEYPCGIVVQSDGKVVVGGISYKADEGTSFYSIFFVRYNSDGSLDRTFADKGIYQEVISDPIQVADFIMQPDGKFLIGGSYTITKDHAFFVKRYLPDGTPDNGYGVNGESTYPFPGISSGGCVLALQSNGDIVAAGSTNDGFSSTILNPVIVRFTANGEVDRSFGSNGLVSTKFDNYASGMSDILVQPDDKIVTALRNYDLEYPWDTSYFAVARYNINGVIDSSFANNGVQITALDGYADPFSTALQNDGKIIISGDVYDSSVPAYYFALVRYIGDRQEKYVHIKHWLHRHGITWDDCPKTICNNLNYYAVERSNNGSSFTEIARIFNRNNQTQFSYEDNAAVSGTNYYRLRTVSTDGAVAYSNIVAIADDGSAAIKIYPNPTQNNLHIEGLSSIQKTKLSIVDFNGNVKSVTIVNSSSFNWNIAQLKQGNYILRIETSDNIVTKKFVKE